MKLSIYTSAFNLLQNGFDWENSLDNFLMFATRCDGEVVIAINTSEDDTLKVIKSIRSPKLKIVETDISYSDPWLDGKIKNEALMQCQNDARIGLDMDERIPVRHVGRWQMFAEELLRSPKTMDALMIPSLDLWGDTDQVRWTMENNLKFKWYLHGPSVRRGPVIWARKADGTVDTSKSDTCEAIYENGDLVRAGYLIGHLGNNYEEIKNRFFRFVEEDGLFIFHLGYVDFQKRVIRNKNFWAKHWEIESGQKGNNVVLKPELLKSETVPHGLKLWAE